MVNWTGQALFKLPCEFIIGATKMEHLPSTNVSEVAFVGRSNVGKSSLLNALTKRKKLARTSKTPGCTRQLNFFSFQEKMRLVDLPGYGYAKASRSEVQGWNKLMYDYVEGRPNLRQVCILIDSRHEYKPKDLDIMDVLDEHALSYQVILTKCDKVSEKLRLERVEAIQALAEKHPALHPDVICTSSEKGMGLEQLRNHLAQFAH